MGVLRTAAACAALSLACGVAFADQVIAVNQVGFRTGDRKLAFANDPLHGFAVLDQHGRVAFRGTARPRAKTDPMTGDDVWELDFTELAEPGRYRIKAPRMLSFDFEISDRAYDDLLRTSSRFFYYQRCGTALAAEHAGRWAHPICHQREGAGDASEHTYVSRRPGSRDGRGGWHDAGDYNRYNPYHAYVAGILMSAYEMYPDRFGDGSSGIPESGNGVPDILDEVWWGLDWTLRMQGDDGQVYHRIHDAKWTGVHAPHEDPNTRYVIDEITAEDTAQCTAAWAMAARLFRPYGKAYPGFWEKCLRAAELSWKHTLAHPYHPKAVGGDLDCLHWAAVELLRTTTNTKYDRFVRQQCRDVDFNSSWTSLYYSDVQLLGMYAYAATRDADPELRKTYTDRIVRLADSRKAVQAKDGYACSLMHYPWMSNAFALGDSMLWLMAQRLTGNSEYESCAANNLSYVLGRNCHNTCFVTAVGSRSPRYPFHQPSMADGIDDPVPGIMVGGPNGNRSAVFETPFPARAWGDRAYTLKAEEKDLQNFYYQEPSISASAPLVFVTAAFAAPVRRTR